MPADDIIFPSFGSLPIYNQQDSTTFAENNRDLPAFVDPKALSLPRLLTGPSHSVTSPPPDETSIDTSIRPRTLQNAPHDGTGGCES